MPYSLLDHTADLGLHIQAPELPELFETAAVALGEQLVETPLPEAFDNERLTVAGDDWPDLLIEWLRELLALWHLEGRAVCGARCIELSPYTLEAEVDLLPFDPAVHTANQEIKAVTYHQLDVSACDTGWQATVIFDL